MNRAPSFQFYPADWLKDLELQSCSLEARGLWIELLCIMHQATPYGYLMILGRNLDETSIKHIVGISKRKYRRLLDELLQNGVARITDSGAVYSKRMVDDHALREVRKAAGRKGGNPALLNQKLNQKDNQGLKQTGNQNPTPSSSSSSSTTKLNTNTKTKAFDPDSVEIKLARLFWKLLKERGYEAKRLNGQAWAKKFDLMLRIDKLSVERIEEVMRWAISDIKQPTANGDWIGWHKVIICPKTFRDKWGQLVDEMNTQQQGNNSKPFTATDSITDFGLVQDAP